MRINEYNTRLSENFTESDSAILIYFVNNLITENIANHNCYTVVLQNKSSDYYSSYYTLENEHSCESDILDPRQLLTKSDIPISVMYLELTEKYLRNDLAILKEHFEIGCDWYLVGVCSPENFIVALKKVMGAGKHRGSIKLLFLVDNKYFNSSRYTTLFHLVSDFWPDTTVLSMENSDLEIRFAAFHYSPYFLVKPRWDGTEFRILKEFAQKFNFTLKLITDDNQWGGIFANNNTGNGVLGIVYEGKAQVGFSALYLWFNEYQYLDYSVSYIRTGITCLVPKAQLVSPWLLPIQPFDEALWAIVVMTLVTSTIALYYVSKITNIFSRNWRRRFRTVDDSVLRVIGMLVLQVPTAKGIRPPPTALRYVITFLEVMFLLVVTSYHSGLASVLTLHRHEAAIETVQDLVDSGLQWGATHDAWIFSILLSPEPRTKTLVERFKVLSEKNLNERTQTRNFAFSLERLQGGYFAIGDYITEESTNHLQLMKEDIYYEYCVYALPKGSPYKQPLDTLILNIQSAGLVLHWEGEVVRNYLPVNVQYRVAQSSATPTESEPIVLELKHIHGAMTILAIGLGSSTLIFILELFWNRKK
ncbi:hypothetical protein LSTR_LSTR014536 [Laodelphax striatellus]|uniref:Ionotropic glutamate receptor C-terminal domain-containing protein n=1 Tax=Laodelphax striatellus TaxID=195883 RepID=A0A482XUI3_LAOST|nr:hypothetical protein LSTR_LSTR014536 [Laodelphax striatellus]